MKSAGKQTDNNNNNKAVAMTNSVAETRRIERIVIPKTKATLCGQAKQNNSIIGAEHGQRRPAAKKVVRDVADG